jgi:hypothetical protein
MIDVNDPVERRSWSRALGVTQTTLKEAIKEVGPSPLRVRRYLGSTPGIASATAFARAEVEQE